MALKLFNTLTRKKEVFKPIKKGQVGFYSCGPTVYDYAHIGNLRAFMCTDILKRYLEYKGYKVKHIMNLTDVDDKTINGSREQKISLKQYTEKYTKAFFEDLEKLNIEKAQIFPKATEHIKQMVSLIKKLIKKKYAYKGDDNCYYYDISKFKNYGKLAKLDLKGLKAGARICQDAYEKEQANDFALWKAWDKADGDVFWETEIGKGRPGWHIECSAMSMEYLGSTFDIHTGGVDLIFPHHTNEIAQSEAATGKQFVKYWIHNEHILVDGKKMSKSLGNFYTLRDLLKKGYEPRAIRFLLLSAQYKQKLNFSFKGLESAKNTLQRLDDFILNLKNTKGNKDNKKVDKSIKKVKDEFEKAMDDDLEISNALAAIFNFIKQINKLNISKKDAKKIEKTMFELDKVLGVIKTKEEKIPKEIMDLIKEREKARKEKDYKRADKIREKIKEKGYLVEDTKEGPKIKKKN